VFVCLPAYIPAVWIAIAYLYAGGLIEERLGFGKDELSYCRIVDVLADNGEDADRCLVALDGIRLQRTEDHG